jgi:AcrR family transcriptional regulator
VRADAQRNRDRIVEVAREVFREQGYDASLDLVAKRAGVGAGTLYRHFPTRESLAFEGSDRDLLLRWFETYVDLITLHKGGAAKITCAMGDTESPIRTKCQVLSGAAGRVMDELAARGAVRDDVDAVQVCRLVGGVATVADSSELAPAAVRPLLEVVADGLLVRA